MIFQSAARATVFTRSTQFKKYIGLAQHNLKLHHRLKKITNYIGPYTFRYGLTTLNKPKSRQMESSHKIFSMWLFQPLLNEKQIQRSYIYANI